MSIILVNKPLYKDRRYHTIEKNKANQLLHVKLSLNTSLKTERGVKDVAWSNTDALDYS